MTQQMCVFIHPAGACLASRQGHGEGKKWPREYCLHSQFFLIFTKELFAFATFSNHESCECTCCIVTRLLLADLAMHGICCLGQSS